MKQTSDSLQSHYDSVTNPPQEDDEPIMEQIRTIDKTTSNHIRPTLKMIFDSISGTNRSNSKLSSDCLGTTELRIDRARITITSRNEFELNMSRSRRNFELTTKKHYFIYEVITIVLRITYEPKKRRTSRYELDTLKNIRKLH